MFPAIPLFYNSFCWGWNKHILTNLCALDFNISGLHGIHSNQ